MFKGKRVLSLLIGVLVFISGTALYGQLRLNEVMASNASVLEDRFGEYPDWIELYNAGSEAVKLNAYFLSDDTANMMKWQLPAMSLMDGAYSVIFASGMDIKELPAFWHTLVNIGDLWRYYLPDSDIGDDWKSSTAATDSWDEAKSSFGYSDDDDTTVVAQTIAIYIQKEIILSSPEAVTDAILYMDYDDGFVAYLNGTEIARSETMSGAGSDVAYNALAGSHEAVMLSGNQPETYSLNEHLHLLQEGSNILAIEVHNTSETSSDLSCIPILMMGFSNFQNALPSGNQYVSVSNHYPHTNFKIDSDGEAIFLSDSEGRLIDSLPNVQLPPDYSYGRVPGYPDTCGYFLEATPGYINGAEFLTEFFNDTVKIEVTGAPFDDYHLVELSAADEDDSIYYTTDLSDPTIDSKLYTAPFSMIGMKVIKARVIRSNSLPGLISTRTVLSGRKPDLPVISVTTEPENLWDYYSGIYVEGPNASSDNPHFGANYWQDWEKPVHVELYDGEGELKFQQDAGTKIFGAWSRAHDQKSMSFFARNMYGENRFEYPFFEKKRMQEYKSFVLRNSGNDYNTVMFRDPLSAYLAARMDLDHQAYQPLVKYLNGEYWGIINMREKINEHFIAGNHMLDKEEINLLENNVEEKHGDASRYREFLTFLRANNLFYNDNYAKVAEYIDIENFIRYWTLNVYVDNKDWPGNNQRFWATTAPGSLFKWIVYDTEFGLGIYNSQAYAYNTLEFSIGEGPERNWANEDWATEVMRYMLKNDDFKNRYINSFADRMNYDFSEEMILPVIDSFQQRIAGELQYHFEKWGGGVSSWESRVDVVRNFFRYRPGNMRLHLIDRFDLSGTHSIDVEVTGGAACHVRINSIEPEVYPFSGIYFEDVPIELEAIPGPGYIFKRWEGTVESEEAIIAWDMSGTADFHAVFETLDEDPDIVINEINYASSLSLDTEDWIELYNNGRCPVDISGWSLEDESSGRSFIIPEGNVMQAGSYLVFTRENALFRKYYPERKAVIGNLGFGFDNGGEGIALLDEEGFIMDAIIYNNVSPWPLDVEGSGSTIELVNPSLENGIGESWQASMNFEGTPCEQNSVYMKVGNDLVYADVRSEVEIYPVPFRNKTTITYILEEEQYVELAIYSSSGQKVAQLEQGRKLRGRHALEWLPEGRLPAGVYVLSLRTEQEVQSKQLVYLGQ